jgi:hypothetical protein
VKKKFLFFIFLFISIFSLSLFACAQTTDKLPDVSDFGNLFPYKIDFNADEIKILKGLDKTTLNKLIDIAKFAKDKNSSNTNQLNNNQNTQITSQQQNPNIQGNTLTLPSTFNQQFARPQQQINPLSQLLGNPQSRATNPDSAPFGFTPNMAPPATQDLAPVQYDNTFVASDGGDCSNFGVIITGGRCGYGPNDMHPKLKLDFRNLCRLTKKKIQLTNSRREQWCMGKPQRMHSGGRAFDSDFSPFSESEKTIIALYFMAHDYNGIGGYGGTHTGNQAPHFDIRPDISRWGPCESYRCCSKGYYASYVQRAFAEIKVDPCDIKINPAEIKRRAIEVLKKMGKEEFAIDKPATS